MVTAVDPTKRNVVKFIVWGMSKSPQDVTDWKLTSVQKGKKNIQKHLVPCMYWVHP